MARSREMIAGALAGLAAGLVASFVMERFQAALPSPEGDEDPATVKAADALSRSSRGEPLDEREKVPAGEAVHYAFGAAVGLAYGVLARIEPRVTAASGLAMGVGVAMLADEIAVPALGLGKPPAQTPSSTHAYSLASHLVFGLVAERTRRAVVALLPDEAW